MSKFLSGERRGTILLIAIIAIIICLMAIFHRNELSRSVIVLPPAQEVTSDTIEHIQPTKITKKKKPIKHKKDSTKRSSINRKQRNHLDESISPIE